MRVPEEVRKCVVFLGVPSIEGGIDLRATGFIVGVPLGDTTMQATYLVTTKHTADKLEGKPFGTRFNVKGGDAATAWADASIKWWRHPTEPDSVDAAVAQFGPGPDFDTKVVPVSMFLTDEVFDRAGIGLGDEVFLAGLFNRLKANRNEPIIRTGTLAAMPRDRIPGVTISGKQVEAEAYLIEARSMGGISGSPVFVVESLHAA